MEGLLGDAFDGGRASVFDDTLDASVVIHEHATKKE